MSSPSQQEVNLDVTVSSAPMECISPGQQEGAGSAPESHSNPELPAGMKPDDRGLGRLLLSGGCLDPGLCHRAPGGLCWRVRAAVRRPHVDSMGAVRVRERRVGEH